MSSDWDQLSLLLQENEIIYGASDEGRSVIYETEGTEYQEHASLNPEFVLSCEYKGVTLTKRFPQSLNAALMPENRVIAGTFVDLMHADLKKIDESTCAGSETPS